MLAVKTNKRPTGRVSDLTLRGRQGALGELGHAVLEAIEERVVGRSGQAPLVGTLEEDRGLPQRERRVPADVAHRPPGALLVAGHERVAAGEAGPAGDGAEREDRALGIA